jgi:4-carboxymuconolactone decarboxylase
MTEETTPEERHRRGMATMQQVYAWETVPDVPGDFFRVTVDHLFGEIWQQGTLTVRERRLMVLGVLAALGETAVIPIQIDAILTNDEFSSADLRDIVLFLTHYVGWPRGSTLNGIVEQRIREHQGSGSAQRFPGSKRPT